MKRRNQERENEEGELTLHPYDEDLFPARYGLNKRACRFCFRTKPTNMTVCGCRLPVSGDLALAK